MVRAARHREYVRTRYLVEFVDAALCDIWAEVMSEADRRGRSLSPADSWIAATAKLRRLPLVSHNRRDFTGIPGVQLISEAPIQAR